MDGLLPRNDSLLAVGAEAIFLDWKASTHDGGLAYQEDRYVCHPEMERHSELQVRYTSLRSDALFSSARCHGAPLLAHAVCLAADNLHCLFRSHSSSSAPPPSPPQSLRLPTLSFFGVYDGHGGNQTAEFLVEHLHANFARELKKLSRSRLALARCLQQSLSHDPKCGTS